MASILRALPEPDPARFTTPAGDHYEANLRRAANPCGCYTCDGSPALRSRMYVCATCGNKRCPRATDHRNECHASNAPGQEGSSYT